MQRHIVLRRLPLLDHLSDTELDVVANHFRLRRYHRGDGVWGQGEAAQVYTFIVEGHIKVTRRRRDGRELIVDVLGVGDPAGAVAVQRQIPYPASAAALTDTKILAIHRDHFQGTLNRHTALQNDMLNRMLGRSVRLVGRLDELAEPAAERRLAVLFVDFLERFGQAREGGGYEVPLPLSRRDIAALINTTVETAIRLMSRWNRDQLVRTERHGFVVVDVDTLRRLASEPL